MTTVASRLLDLYRSRTPNSARWAERAAKVFPSGITHDGRYLEPYPLYVTRAAGAHKWDADDHRYVDYAGGHGALLLGHNHPHVVAAVEEQLARGTHYGSCHGLEVRWGELVQQLMPSAERVRFTSSGTEATLLAVRLARAFTGKRKIVRFLGHFHGWHDHMAFGVVNHHDGSPSPGIVPGVAEDVLLAPAGDATATAALLERGDVAAVIIEPTGASWGQVPLLLPEFLVELRKLTADHRAVLIFDEVISGFRCCPGGAQGYYNIKPDLTTLAKILGGGLPGAAVVGQAAILDCIDFVRSQASGREKVLHQGTFNGNPLCAAAGIATLEIVGSTDACAKANAYAAQLREALHNVIVEEGLPWLDGTFSGFHIFTNPERLAITREDIAAGRVDHRLLKTVPRELTMKLRLGMLVHGVEIFSWPGGPTSSVHSHEDLRQTADAFRGTLRLLRDEGLV